MGFLAVPFHFSTTFLVSVVAAAGIWVTIARPQFAPSRRGPRWTFGAAWVLLGLGEIAHGSLIAATEVEQIALALRSGAYAFFVLAVIGSRAKSTTVSANQAAGTVAGSNFMPTFLAFSAAIFTLRSSIPAARRLAFALGLFAGSELLFLFGGYSSGSNPSLLWYFSHGVRLAGGVAVAYWLWQALRSSLQIRFIAVFVGLMLIVVVAISSSMTQVFASNVRQEAQERANFEGDLQRRSIEQGEEQALRRARLIAELDEVRRLFAEGSPALAQVVQTLQRPGGLFDSSSGVDFVAFFDQNAAVLALSATNPTGVSNLTDADAVSLAGSAVVQSALQQIQAASIDAIGPNKLGIIGAYPVLAPRGTEAPGAPAILAGAVAVGRVLDLGFLLDLPGVDQESDEEEVSILNRERVLVTTFTSPVGLIGNEKRLIQRSVFDQKENYLSEKSIADIQYFTSFVPLERRDGLVVAALAVSQRSEVLELTQRDVGRALFLFSLVAAGIGVVLSYLSGARITKPILDLTEAAERVRQGDLDVKVSSSGEDEVASLSATFDEMTSSLLRLTGDLRAAATEELELRTRIETILQSMADAVIAVDEDGHVEAFNREAERLLRLSSAKAMGKPVANVLKVMDLEGREIDLPLYSLKRGSVRGAIGSSLDEATHVAISSAPIESEDGSIIGAVAVVRDLTREIQVERMKTEFLSNISHELRTPLTPIKGYTEILRKRVLPRQQMLGFLDTMQSSIRRLERIVDMLVDFAAMEAGRLVPRKVPVDINQATATLVAEWSLETKKHQFERRGFSKIPTLMVDERLVPRAIDELVDNAVKFSPSGGKVMLSAEIERTGNGSGTVRVSVADQGIGMSEEELNRIFEDFVQVDPSETRQFGGLGLGLAYVRRIVEAHDGSLEVSSSPRKGSKFTLVLPEATIVGGAPTGSRASAKARRARGPVQRRKSPADKNR